MNRFIYKGIYYPVIGNATLGELHTKKYTHRNVYVKKLGGWTGFWSFLPYIGIKCMTKGKKPYRKFVVDKINNHPEMRIEKHYFNEFGYCKKEEAKDKNHFLYAVIRRSKFKELDGLYIGDIATAYSMSNLVYLQGADYDSKVVAVGFNKEEKKWYGWSHRGKYGFGIGSTVREGDIAYNNEIGEWTAETLEDAKQMAIDFARSIA
jgi:hypothetical protein